ncbi:hypothetical protein JCM10449v2_000610 [Rhodotorula kratochvilovae]
MAPNVTRASRRRREAKVDSDAPDEDEGPTPRRSLLDLPDELLQSIWRHLYESLMPDSAMKKAGRYVSMDLIVINHRIFDLAFPIWTSRVTVPALASEQGGFLSRLLFCSSSSNITHLSISLSDTAPTLSLAVLVQLGTLEFLDLRLLPGNTTIGREPRSDVATIVNGLIHEQHNLKRIRFEEAGKLPDDCFSLQDAPHVEELRANDRPWLRGALSGGAPNLRVLTLQGPDADFAELEIPWQTLDELGLYTLRHISNPESLVQALQGCPVDTVLRCLRLRLDRFPQLPPLDYPSWGHKILAAAAAVSVREIRIYRLSAFRWASSGIQLPSVTEVALRGTCDYSTGDTLRHLSNFLAMFPNLAKLSLVGGRFASTTGSTAARDIIGIDEATLCLTYPHLRSFVAFIQISTGILNFRYRGSDEAEFVRWTRANRREDFVRDSFSFS